MRARVLAFPAPRTPVFRRSGPLRWVAAPTLLLVVSVVVALVVSSIAKSPETRPRRALQGGAGGRPGADPV